MTDYSDLSKEELIALLQNKKSENVITKTPPKPAPEEYGICQFKPSRPKNAPQCTDNATTPYGFCKKHSRTVQAKKARDIYEANQLITEIQEERGIEDKLPPIEEKEVTTGGGNTTATGDTVGDGDIVSDPVETSSSEVKSSPPSKKPLSSSKAKAPPKKKPPPLPPKTKVANKATPTVESKPEKHGRTSLSSTGPVAVQKGVRRPTVRSKTIRPNYWGRYEDPETHIVFDPSTKCAYGVQESTGRVTALKPEHVSVCQRNGWNYNVPYESDEEEEEISSSIEDDESQHLEDDESDETIPESDFESEDESGTLEDVEEDEDENEVEGDEDEEEASSGSEEFEESEGEFDSDAADDFDSDEDEY